VSTRAETKYLRQPDGVYIAYCTAGEGPDVAFDVYSQSSNVDLIWEEPVWKAWLSGVTEFARVILHDRRGVGVSSRNVPPPTLETRAADLLAVLDAVGAERPVLSSAGEPGAMLAFFAATHPDRVSGLFWNIPTARAAWAPDYPWGGTPEDFARSLELAELWGTADWGRVRARFKTAEQLGVPDSESDSLEIDDEDVRLFARLNRNAATPDVAEAIARIWWQTDVRAVLPSVRARTMIGVGEADNVDEANYVASLMPNATVHAFPGRAGVAVDEGVALIRELCGVRPVAASIESVLATVLFTDIVDSTAQQAALGDRAWRELLTAHNTTVREALVQYGGVERDTAGDGFFATFDGPARAIFCARDAVERVRALGIEIRAGIHIGECELVEGKVAGVAVSTGARIAAKAGSSEVLVSQTIKDLVAGSRLAFEDAGEHELKGLEGHRQLYRVAEALQ
jgi:class 3 adenylate cyclase/pimeloyl-ACP methyl ester carboxylesterase